MKNKWLWSVSPENWEIVKSKNIWGSKIHKERIQQIIKKGDLIIFYVIKTNEIQGIYEIVSNWRDSDEVTWHNDIQSTGNLRFISKIDLQLNILGNVLVTNLHDKLEMFIEKGKNTRNLVLQGRNGFPSNFAKPLSENDYLKIKKLLLTSNNIKIEGNYLQNIPQKLLFNENDGKLIIEKYLLKSKYIIDITSTITNNQIMEIFNVANMGGIRYSKKFNILLLFISCSKDYKDEIFPETNIIMYSGEGQNTMQLLTRGNKQITNSKTNPILLFKEKCQEKGKRKRGSLDNIYLFIGKVKYLNHYWENEQHPNAGKSNVIKFILERLK